MVKNYSISLIRLLSMVMIISCHILQGIGNSWAFWVNVGVQIFLILSGYLYGSKNIDNAFLFYKKQFKKILIPYVILVNIVFIIELIFLNKSYSFSLMLGSLFGFGGVNGNSSLLTHTWFITYILICYLLIPVLQRIFNANDFGENMKRFVCIILFIQALEFFNGVNITTCWINTFIFGYVYKRCCIDEKKKTCMKIVMLFVFLLLFPVAVLLQEKLLLLPDILSVYSRYIINYGHMILGIILFLGMFEIFEKIHLKENFIFNFSDKYSYYIYLVHQIFILNSFSLLYVTDYFIFNIFIILVLTIVSSIVLKFLSDYIFKFLEFLLKIKSKFVV